MSSPAQYPVNIQQLRKTLKIKWLTYYQQNCHWLGKMQIWGNYNGDRRPLSGFILATVAVLEPNLAQILPFIADLNSNPDEVVAALGLDFNPDEHLHLLDQQDFNKQDLNKQDNITANRHVNFPQDQSLADRFLAQGHNGNGHGNGNGYSNSHTNNHNSNKPNSQPTRIISPFDTITQDSMSGNNGANGSNGSSGHYHQNGNGQGINGTKASLQEMVSPEQLLPPQQLITPVKFKESLPPTGEIMPSGVSVPPEVNQSSILSPRNLANWIDDFCQGKDWNQDEALFIPF